MCDSISLLKEKPQKENIPTGLPHFSMRSLTTGAGHTDAFRGGGFTEHATASRTSKENPYEPGQNLDRARLHPASRQLAPGTHPGGRNTAVIPESTALQGDRGRARQKERTKGVTTQLPKTRHSGGEGAEPLELTRIQGGHRELSRLPQQPAQPGTRPLWKVTSNHGSFHGWILFIACTPLSCGVKTKRLGSRLETGSDGTVLFSPSGGGGRCNLMTPYPQRRKQAVDQFPEQDRPGDNNNIPGRS